MISYGSMIEKYTLLGENKALEEEAAVQWEQGQSDLNNFERLFLVAEDNLELGYVAGKGECWYRSRRTKGPSGFGDLHPQQ